MNLVIEKNIPLPTRTKPAKGELRAAMESMSLNDSFFLACDTEAYTKHLSRITANYFHLKPKIFTSRKIEGGVRVWRIR